MIYISHRGNIFGPNPKEENTPSYIDKALKAGFDVEIDVWFLDDNFYLGHDSPDTLIKKDYLNNDRFWCHAKNVPALEKLLELGVHCFWHQKDDVTLTSKSFVWIYPGKPLCKNGIIVMPENKYDNWKDISNKGIKGICSDFIAFYEKK
jgi:hypothetical protein